ncbi:hypothetical protein B0F90DRAFT_1737716 [Multifurca ochricompacta]|uniref:Uncharacterized protein n=1 Tax=Multifurca ochricompacta TaxID=376703 RepID=A0AAD4QM02_9AGAM|nr:hypothetical protein B0F90DRAFT_1737716 [Multifurca ochricompacta]
MVPFFFPMPSIRVWEWGLRAKTKAKGHKQPGPVATNWCEERNWASPTNSRRHSSI